MHTDSLPPRLTIWSGTNAVARRKRSWARLLGCAVLVTRNAAGQTQHIAANYRPRSSLLLLSGLVGEKLADTPSPSTSWPASPETDLYTTATTNYFAIKRAGH
jgi:hypothetical protein